MAGISAAAGFRYSFFCYRINDVARVSGKLQIHTRIEADHNDCVIIHEVSRFLLPVLRHRGWPASCLSVGFSLPAGKMIDT